MIKKHGISILVLSVILMLSMGYSGVVAARPPSTTLVVTITNPVDGLQVDTGGCFIVSGSVMSTKGDAGVVDTYVQYAVGEGSVDFKVVAGSDVQIVTGAQPQRQTLLNGQSYDVSWTLTGRPGTYEVRIYSQGATAKPGASASRTVTILSPPLPPGVEAIDLEYQDSAVGYGSAVGSYKDTYYADRVYEILREGRNTQGTKKSTDDITELGWIFEFHLSTAPTTMRFYFYGYAVFTTGDTDTSFIVQQQLPAGWQSVTEIRNTGVSKFLSADLTCLTSSTVKLRILDNDRTLGNTEISSLYVDQAYIGIDNYVPPTSGIELLVGPYTCHRFQTWENHGYDWYHDNDVPIMASAATDIAIADIDLDGNNEVVVSETISDEYGRGVVQVFDFDVGMAPIQTLIPPPDFTMAVTSVGVGNIDNEPYPEIVTGFARGGAIIWDRETGAYVPALVLHDSGVVDMVALGNLDEDAESEIVLTFGWDSIRCELAVYDFDGLTWTNVANYSGFSEPGWEFGDVQTCDFDGNGIDEIVVSYRNNPLRVLSYADGQLQCIWTSSFVYSSLGIAVGDMTNDGRSDIIICMPYANLYNGIRILEYIGGTFVNTSNITVTGMEGIWDKQMAIGDIDADGLNELVVANGPGGIYSEGMLYIFRNDTLLLQTSLGANDGNCVAIGDYDNDCP